MAGAFVRQTDISAEDMETLRKEIRRLSEAGGVWLPEGAAMRLLVPSGVEAAPTGEEPREEEKQ